MGFVLRPESLNVDCLVVTVMSQSLWPVCKPCSKHKQVCCYSTLLLFSLDARIRRIDQEPVACLQALQQAQASVLLQYFAAVQLGC